jgi:hypothetical protein
MAPQIWRMAVKVKNDTNPIGASLKEPASKVDPVHLIFFKYFTSVLNSLFIAVTNATLLPTPSS